LSQYTIFQGPSSYAYWDMNRINISRAKAHNYTAGADYNFSDNQVIGVLVTGDNAVTHGGNAATTHIYNNYHTNPDSVLNTNSVNGGRTNQYSFNLNYKAKLDSSGRSLNIDLDYVPYTRSDNVQLSNFTYLPDGGGGSAPYHTFFPSTQKINIWSGKIDYTYKVGKRWSLESGLKYTSTVSENQFEFYNTAGTVPVFDPSRSNQFRYTENTGAGYTSISGEFGRWNFKGGIRAEYTTTKGVSLSLDSINVNKYLRIFPTAFVTYKASENDEFGFNYSKRIERPDYRQLNPAKNYLSPYNYASGNPFLRPAVINSLQLSYTLHQNYTFAAVYTQIDDLASNVTVQDNVNRTFYNTQQNIGSIKDLGTELSSVHHPVAWWEINNTAQGYFRSQSSDQPGNTYNYHQFYFYLRTDHAFTIDKNSGLKAELSAWYNSAIQQGTLLVAKTYDISAGISKQVFNKQGTLKFSAADLLYSNPYRISIQNEGQNNGIYQRNDTRTFTLSFSYKLGKSVAAARQRATASEEEKKRVN
ncbi:outer membrane beta-barrel family protein, partial [Pedobacter sp.]|uniref:outer membrane beta-barrel family protein n=1 Tax=Pedobacter sp. TaxID=1411316 RepID=UPI002CBD8DD0